MRISGNSLNSREIDDDSCGGGFIVKIARIPRRAGHFMVGGTDFSSTPRKFRSPLSFCV
jgi:hypothetical protein